MLAGYCQAKCRSFQKGTIIEDIDAGTDWILRALRSSGYRADFSPQSLWEIDRFFDEHTQDGTAKQGGLLSEDLGQRLFGLGAYIGEVVRRAKGGEWLGDDSDPETEIAVELVLSDGARCWPIQRVMKRFKNGSQDGIAAWGSGLGLQVSTQAVLPRKNFFKRLFG